MAASLVALVLMPSRAAVESSSHSVTGLTVAGSAPRQAVATVSVDGAGTVYVRYALADTSRWNSAGQATAGVGDTTVMVNLNGLTTGAGYDVEASADQRFPDSATHTVSYSQNRAPGLDFDLASVHETPRGIWGNSDTIWVVNDRNNPNNDILAYQRTPAGDYGTRDTSRDIDLDDSDNRDASGIWSDGTTMFVVDVNHEKVFAYQLSGGARDTSREFDLDSGHNQAEGIWANADTFWVVNDETGDENVVLAYKRTPATEYGNRDGTKDIALRDAGNTDPKGIWSDGVTIWVVDSEDLRLYAYRLSDGARDAEKDVVLADVTGQVRGLWGAGGALWVTNGGSDDKVFGYYMPGAGIGAAEVSAIEVASTAASSISVTATVSEAGTYHLRLSEAGVEDWQRASSVTASGAGDITFNVTGMEWRNRNHVLEVSKDADFNSGVEQASFVHRPSHLDFTVVDPVPGARRGHLDGPRGIWANADTIWVVFDVIRSKRPPRLQAHPDRRLRHSRHQQGHRP